MNKFTEEQAVRLAVMTAIAHAMILRDAKVDHHPIDTVASDIAKASRVVADALLQEAEK